MKLERLTERIWIYPYEEERDRPNLTYIRGERWSLVVDAGGSADHVGGFYRALVKEGLPLPAITVLTHWHWDHTFGMHAVHGLCLAGVRTCQYLKDFKRRIETEGTDFFFDLDESIRLEYKGGRPVIVTLPDIVCSGEMVMDAGNCPIRVFQAEAPHTDDSLLIEVTKEKVLILGDAICGTFPEWIKDPVLAGKLAETIKNASPTICVSGHWSPLPPEIIVQDLLEGT